jgi:hypothetical protein
LGGFTQFSNDHHHLLTLTQQKSEHTAGKKITHPSSG